MKVLNIHVALPRCKYHMPDSSKLYTLYYLLLDRPKLDFLAISVSD